MADGFDFNFLTGNRTPDFNPGATDKTRSIKEFFSDPNALRLLADIGSRFGQGQTAGQALGDPTQALIRRTQFQEAAGNQQQKEADFREALIEALKGGKLLSPIGDQTGADSVTFNQDGTFSLKGGKPAPTTGQLPTTTSMTDRPLELDRGRRTDLSPFF